MTNHGECDRLEARYRADAAAHLKKQMTFHAALIEACAGNMQKVGELYQKHAERIESRAETANVI